MADRGDTHYNLPRTNLVFLGFSALLVICAIWMVMDDWSREWKNHQREFQHLQYEQAVAEAESRFTGNEEWVKERDALQAQIDEAQAALDKDADYLAKVEEVDVVDGLFYKATAERKIAQAKWNWSKFLVNQAAAAAGGSNDPEVVDEEHPGYDDLVAAVEDFEQKDLDLIEAQKAEQAAQVESERVNAELAAMTTERDKREAALAEFTRDLGLLETRMTALGPSAFHSLRDAPGLDFVAPTIKVRKVELPHLRKNYNFNTVQRVDMCQTCHMGADVAGFEDAPAPHTTHPRLDLFLSPGSPHPVDTFGCTVCHEGAAETTDFTRAVHTPETEEQHHQWEEDRDYHHWHLWEWPMLPTKYTEAGCYSCHSVGGTLENIRDDAPKLAKGLELMEQYGCYSCHNIADWRDNRKSGPSLRNIASKISPDFAKGWIKDPKDFRESTWMPQIFHLENSESETWDDTTIAAIQTYLWKHSEGLTPPAPPTEVKAAADADRGKELFQQVGCTACHNAPETPEHEFSDFGPDLAGIGSKLDEDWMYGWILDPTSWWPDTRMPNLRLEPQQAMDIARYLAGEKKDGWSDPAVEANPADRDAQALLFLEKTGSIAQASDTLDRWKGEGQDKVLEELGEKWISRQGCYSCHDIPGFEAGMPIGTDLSDWGNKNIHQLAFELFNEHVPGHFDEAVSPSRHGFAELKLSNPRRFDRGLQVPALDKLRMPQFDFTEEEIEAITTVLLGLKDNSATIFEPAYPKPDLLQKTLDEGAYLVRRNNCYGCHRFGMDKLVVDSEEGYREYHGLLNFEDEDEEATYFKLWKPDADLAVEEDGGNIGSVAEAYWELENEDGDLIPWPVERGEGGGMVDGLAQYYVDSGEVGSIEEAFPLVPPFLYREGEKVRAPWTTEFLLAPYTLRPWLSVRMPRFTFTNDEARNVAMYFAALSIKEWPSRYVRELRADQRLTREEMAAEITGVEAEHIRMVEDGERHSVNMFAKIEEWGTAQGFHLDPPPTLPFEQIDERSPDYLASKEAEAEDYLDRAATLVGSQGVGCYACHIKDGVEPGGDKLSWGPDLAYSRERLRPDWVRQWVIDAQKIYPGTKMPTAIDFMSDPKLQSILEGSPEDLVEAIKDFLLNSDRAQEMPPATAHSGHGPRDRDNAAESGGQ